MRVDSIAPGTSPLVLEMSSASSRTTPAGGATPLPRGRRPVERKVGAAGVERHVLRAAPGVEERVRRDGAVVAHREQRDRVDLEVEVHGRELGVAGLAHEAEHVAGLDLAAVDRERRVGREMRVVELVAGPVAQPQPPAADVVPADREHRPVGDREQRRPERREDVLTVMPAAA